MATEYPQIVITLLKANLAEAEEAIATQKAQKARLEADLALVKATLDQAIAKKNALVNTLPTEPEPTP